MADYKELLRRAISALPENNGAARRAVYEKARSALVAQLRAIEPPLPAREITQHRLQLEDCIRQVEQEASEAVISLGRDTVFSRPVTPPPPRPAPAPAPVAPAPEPTPTKTDSPTPPEKLPEPAPQPEPQFVPRAVEAPEPLAPTPVAPKPDVAAAEPVGVEPEPNPLAPAPAPIASIEEIIAQAASTTGVEVVQDDQTDKAGAPVAPPAFSTPIERPEPKPFFFAPRKPSDVIGEDAAPVMTSTALASQPDAATVIIEPPLPVEPALSSVSEVDVEGDTKAAEGAIERAIETLDREARGETTEPLPERDAALKAAVGHTVDDPNFVPIRTEARSGTGLTIFLLVFAMLLVGAGGAGFWAWREGYVNLDQMFGRTEVAAVQTPTPEPTAGPSLDATVSDPLVSEDGENSGPGNTATTAPSEPTSSLEGTADDRLAATPSAPSALPSLNGDGKIEERLTGLDTQISGTSDPSATVDPSVLAGNQSLLLEASANGQAGAVPYSGSVEWTESVDELGMPTLVGNASIPARNLAMNLIIRRNTDPVLPASHLMEITFNVPDTFAGGNIATLAAVLLKDSELVPGTALVGAGARVLGNTFLFALSASPTDVESNIDLLQNRRWLDLAMVYGSGRNAILTLEKDDEAQEVFDRVMAAWAE
jgi:hypothetical protein